MVSESAVEPGNPNIVREMEKSKNQKASGSVVGRDMTITGDVTFQGHLHVEGTIAGSLVGDRAGLSLNGCLEGDIRLQELDCHGNIDGMVLSARLILRKSADISGSIESQDLQMMPGARFVGEMKIANDRNGEPAVRSWGNGAGPLPGRGEFASLGIRRFTPASAEFEDEDGKTLASLSAAVRGGSQLVIVTSDKSEVRRKLCLKLQAMLDNDFNVIFISDSSGSFRELLLRISAESNTGLTDPTDQDQVLQIFATELNASLSRGKPMVLIIDNGEKMYPATLERIVHCLAGAEGTEMALAKLVLFGGVALKRVMDIEDPKLLACEPDCVLDL